MTWVEGDAEDLPFDSATFDRVLSVFGVQFARLHEVAASELARVCRPGGVIGLVNWTPSGVIGELFSILGRAATAGAAAAPVHRRRSRRPPTARPPAPTRPHPSPRAAGTDDEEG